jgi:hypothetical protein
VTVNTTQIKKEARWPERILSFGLGLSFGLWHLSFFCHLPPYVILQVCTAHNHKGQMLTKRIVRILTIESAAGSRLTYEKELLDSRKNSRFYKTNHHSCFPPMTQITTFLAYVHFEARPSTTIDLSHLLSLHHK